MCLSGTTVKIYLYWGTGFPCPWQASTISDCILWINDWEWALEGSWGDELPVGSTMLYKKQKKFNLIANDEIRGAKKQVSKKFPADQMQWLTL